MTARSDPEAIASEDFLANNAKEVFFAAPRTCNPQVGCAEYHRLWPLARLAKVHGTQLAGADFFCEAFTEFPKTEIKRLLICGAADTGLLATLCGCLTDRLSEVRIILADRCQTVIDQNRRLAERLNLSAEFLVSEFSELQIAPVDVIVSHSLLPFFTFEQRVSLLELWRQLLNPGGRVLFSNSVFTSAPSVDRVSRFQFDRSGILSVAKQLQFSAEQLTQLQQSLDVMMEKSSTTLVRPVEEELIAQINQAGFEIKSWNRIASGIAERGPYSSSDSTERIRVEACLATKS
ncbi:MAG: class I SAM-dependent methyltransferase [Pseudomonadales bacterium]|nr:class I SAM-dependent methyltransferase [Pseudomonadales bacterium]